MLRYFSLDQSDGPADLVFPEAMPLAQLKIIYRSADNENNDHLKA